MQPLTKGSSFPSPFGSLSDMPPATGYQVIPRMLLTLHPVHRMVSFYLLTEIPQPAIHNNIVKTGLEHLPCHGLYWHFQAIFPGLGRRYYPHLTLQKHQTWEEQVTSHCNRQLLAKLEIGPPSDIIQECMSAPRVAVITRTS